MALPAKAETPVDAAERLLGDPNADPGIVVALIGELDALQDDTLNKVESNAADRIGRRTSLDEWGQEAQAIGQALRLGRLVGALRRQFQVVGQ